MKKISVWLLSLLLVVSLAVSVSAITYTATLTADRTSVSNGDSIQFVLSVTEVANCKSGSVRISYSADVFERGESSWLLSNMFINEPNGDAVFAFSGGTKVSGDIYRFELKVKEGAKVSASDVSVTLTLKDADGGSSTVTESVSISIACTHAYDNACDTTCNLCGAERTAKHTWDEGKVTTAATCTAEGVKTFSCTACGQTKTEAVSKVEHSYDNGKVTTEATCEAEGVKIFTCTVCGDTKTETVARKEHVYDKGQVTTEATCTGEGVKTFTCTLCGKTKTETISAPGHVYDNDCDPDCNTCGETRETEHNYSDRWSSDETGHWHECTSCGEVLELLPHTPGPDPTEDEDQICLDCGFVLQVAGTHVHRGVGDWLSDDSSHWHLCACGEILETQEHTWDEGTLDETAGVITYTCIACGHPRMESVQLPTETTPPDTEPPVTEPSATAPSATEDPGHEEPAEPFPWWIVILVVGALLVAAVVFVIIGIVKSKKQTGKYCS